jgi:hypothetical protein
MKKFFVLFLIIMFALANMSPGQALKKVGRKDFIPVQFVEGSSPSIELLIYAEDQALDFNARKPMIRLNINANTLIDPSALSESFKLVAYEKNGSIDKQIISIVNTTLLNERENDRLFINVDLNYFAESTKEIFFDLHNAQGILINTYKTTITAINKELQSTSAPLAASPASCNNTEFGDCQLTYLLNKISFEAIAQNRMLTKVYKNSDGSYRVSIPVARKRDMSGRNEKAVISNIAAAIENLGITAIVGAGSSVLISDNGDNIFTVGTGLKVGLGVADPLARFDISAGDVSTPPLKLGSGTLTSSAVPGSIEYDGNRFYVTTSSNIRKTLAFTDEITGGGASVPADIVTESKTQTLTNKTLSGPSISSPSISNSTSTNTTLLGTTTVNGTLSIVSGAPGVGKVLTSNGSGVATWQAVSAASSEYTDGGDTRGKSRILGNNDNYSLSFETNNGTRLHIAAGGNIGVGNLNPNALLTVNGTVSLLSQSSAPSATAGFGKLYVNGNNLYFKDGANNITKINLAGGGSTGSGNGNLNNLVEDTSPQLGGNLDVNGQQITSAGGANIVVQANGTGTLVINEAGNASDTRIEGDSLANLFFVDASADNIGINYANPGARLTVNGTTALVPSSTTNIVGAAGLTVTNGIMRIQGNGGAVTVSANPQIADGVDGQVVVIKASNNTNTVKFNSGSGLRLQGNLPFTMGLGDMLTLMYDAGEDLWIEVSRADN